MAEVAWRPLIYLDSNIFIDAYEGNPLLFQAAKSLMDRLIERPGLAITSELSLAEVLVKPQAEGNTKRKRDYLELMIWSGVVDLVTITRDLLIETARLRATHPTKLKLADSIHLVTAIRSGCRIFASRDKGIMPPAGMRRMHPDIDGVEAIMQAVR